MRHELKALALIVLLAVGAAEPAAAMAYRFDMNLGWTISSAPTLYCFPSCRDRFIADTGISDEYGTTTGTLVVDSAGVGAFSITIGDWSETFNAKMMFLMPSYEGELSVPTVPLIFLSGTPTTGMWGRINLCGPVVSPPNTVQGVADQASKFYQCDPYNQGDPVTYLSGKWIVIMTAYNIRYVPEPGTLALLSLGLLGLGFTRRLH